MDLTKLTSSEITVEIRMVCCFCGCHELVGLVVGNRLAAILHKHPITKNPVFNLVLKVTCAIFSIGVIYLKLILRKSHCLVMILVIRLFRKV